MTSLHFKRIWSYQDSPSTFLCVIPTSVPHSDASHHLLFLHASYQDSREKGSKCANYNKLILNYLLQVYSKLQFSLNCRRSRFDPLNRKILWRKEWLPSPVFYLTWTIPWTEEPGRLQSMRSQESGSTEQLTLSLFHFLPSSCRNTFVVVVHSLSSVKLFVTPWTAERQASLCTWDRNT